MIKYHLEISAHAEKELRQYQQKLQTRLINKILALSDNPRPQGFKKLFASFNFRIRIGDYRIVYSINDANRLVKILDIGHRKDIYR